MSRFLDTPWSLSATLYGSFVIESYRTDPDRVHDRIEYQITDDECNQVLPTYVPDETQELATILESEKHERMVYDHIVTAVNARPVMKKALRKAAETFERYAKLHQVKRTPEADHKAAENQALAHEMRRAIAKAEGRA
jgi:hypothetical protein